MFNIYHRHWDTDLKTKSEAWFVSSFVEQVIPAEGSLLSCFLVSSMDNGKMSIIKLTFPHITDVYIVRDMVVFTFRHTELCEKGSTLAWVIELFFWVPDTLP